jgi:hypothetical protein
MDSVADRAWIVNYESGEAPTPGLLTQSDLSPEER